MNQFAECILEQYDLFEFRFSEQPKAKYPPTNIEKSNVWMAKFEWSWNGYTGYGEIHFNKETYELCNEFGENFSNMTVRSDSPRPASGGRNNCALYNDKAMAELFARMLIALPRG